MAHNAEDDDSECHCACDAYATWCDLPRRRCKSRGWFRRLPLRSSWLSVRLQP